MDIQVYGRVSGFNYEHVATVDLWKSLIVTEYFQDVNTFELTVKYSQSNANLYVPETLIEIRNVLYYVNDARVDDLETSELKVSGKSLMAKAYDRVIDKNYAKTDKPEVIAANLFNSYVSNSAPAARRFNYLKMPTVNTFSSSSVIYQNSYGVVGTELATFMDSYNFGVVEKKSEDGILNVVEFVQGHDYSDWVEISTDYENLEKAGYENSTTDFKSLAITLGEGENSARVRVDFTNDSTTPTGIERREVYVDARDLQKTDSTTNVTMTDAQYIQALKDRAKTKLADQQRILSLSGELVVSSEMFVLGRDFGLGDTVKIRSSLFNVSNTAMITAMKYTYDYTGEYVEPTFGKQSPTVFDILKRK